METNKWNVCFQAYMNECTRIRIIRDSFQSINMWHKSGLVIFSLLFIIFVSLTAKAAIMSDKDSYNFFFPILLIFEVLTIYLVDKAQTIYRSDNYTDIELSHLPPENIKDQRIRYLKFRRTLKEQKIEPLDALNLTDILKVRIELQEKSRLTVKGFFGFAVTFAMVILAATMKDFDVVTIAQVAAVGLLSLVVIYMFVSVKPNKLEQLYELKYFLVMYEKECRVKSL